MSTEAKFWMWLCLVQALLSLLVIFTRHAHACEITPQDWAEVEEELSDE